MPDNVVPSIILCLPFLAGGFMFVFRAAGRNLAVWLMTGTALLGLLLTLWLHPALADGGALRQAIPWAPTLGLDLGLRVDGFSWLFMLLICGIGMLVGVYARYYMPADDPLSRFYALLLAFFWEMTSLFSFLLIGYWHHGASARDGARMALIVTSGGGLCLFAGMLL